MNDDIKAEWVKRLRSGEYKQGKEYLHKGDKYCCLGVLCEMAVEAGIVKKETRLDDVTFYDESVGVLPAEVQNWANINHAAVQIGSFRTLTELNDEGMEFEEIACMIENRL